MFLGTEELIELTGKRNPTAQMRALRFMGIEHKVRPDHKILVLKSHLEKLLDGVSSTPVIRSVEPDWDAMDGSSS